MDQMQEYFRRILKVLIYIESHIDEEMNLHELAKIAHYSPFHFHRIFQCIVGEPVHKYVKRLRLEKAAAKLRDTNTPVTEIALNYDTPSAFTKAFKLHMGQSPSDFRAMYKIAKEKIDDLPMIYPEKIEKILDMDVLFIRKKGCYDKSAWEAWDAMVDFIHAHKKDASQVRCFSVPNDDPSITAEEKLRFDACVLGMPELKSHSEIGSRIIKGGKYAIFNFQGPYERLDETFSHIFAKWVPNSHEEIDDIERPAFCEHTNMQYVEINPEILITKIYVALK